MQKLEIFVKNLFVSVANNFNELFDPLFNIYCTFTE